MTEIDTTMVRDEWVEETLRELGTISRLAEKLESHHRLHPDGLNRIRKQQGDSLGQYSTTFLSTLTMHSSPSAAKYLKTKSDFAADTPANKKSPLEGTGGKDKERSPYYERFYRSFWTDSTGIQRYHHPRYVRRKRHSGVLR